MGLQTTVEGVQKDEAEAKKSRQAYLGLRKQLDEQPLSTEGKALLTQLDQLDQRSEAAFKEAVDLAAQFNTEKLNWLNAHYLKQADDARLVADVRARLEKRGVTVSDTPELARIVALYKGRVNNLNQLADEAEVFYLDLHPAQELLDTHLTSDVLPALRDLAAGLANVEWQAPAIAALIKATLAQNGLKMPKLAMPLRVMLVGQTHTPSVDAVVTLFARETVLARMGRYLA